MNYLNTLFFIGLFLVSTNGNAQIKNNQQLAYHYGLVTGYELKNRQITFQALPTTALFQGLEAYQTNTNTVSMKEAEQVMKVVIERPTAASLEQLGYAYGVLIGSNWKTYEIAATATNLAAFEEGITGVFDGTKNVLSEEEVQLKIMQACQQLLADKKALQVKNNEAFLNKNKARPNVVVLENGLQYEVLKAAKGTTIGTTNKQLKIQYQGQLRDGTVFDDALEKPAIVTRKTVLAGWKDILPLMRENQTLKVYIPPSLGYGDQARGAVPAHSILIYEMTLLEVLD